jgi:hypothetical protein
MSAHSPRALPRERDEVSRIYADVTRHLDPTGTDG